MTNEGSRTLDEHAALFFDPEEAARLLADWGWQENAFRAFEDGQPTDTGMVRPYLHVGVTRYQSSDGAAAALPYVGENLRPPRAHREIPMSGVIGDESRQYVGQLESGSDLTVLVRSRSMLIGISTSLVNGDPSFDPVQIAEGIIQRAATP